MEWLAVNEVSMCTLNMVTLLSQVAGNVWAGNRVANSTVPFGGLNMVLIGDFHQFPPVGWSTSALYSLPQQRNTSVVGKAIYEQFETVVCLTEQNHITDHQWLQILQ
jgi:hypothetical protein